MIHATGINALGNAELNFSSIFRALFFLFSFLGEKKFSSKKNTHLGTNKKNATMDATVNVLNWFEVPVTDVERAKKFYEAVFNIQMETMEMLGMQMAGFPYEPMGGKLSGALVKSDMHKPSGEGMVVYFNANPDLSEALGRVEAAGGKIVMPKTPISEDVGYMAFFVDSEGNTVGLHSQQ